MLFLVAQTKALNVALLLIGLLCLVLAFFVIFLYKKKLNQEKDDRGKFKIQEMQVKYKIFYFWGHVAYLLIIFSLFIVAIIFIAIGFGALLE